MASIFAGLESARQALSVSQEALEVTSQNIANSSTTGYSRQRLVTNAIAPDTGDSKFVSNQAAVGGGVTASSVEQIRNDFLDTRYRSENSTKSYYDGLSDTLSQLEDVFNELDSSSSSTDTATGLSGDVSSLVSSLTKLQASPDDTSLASSVRSAMDTICQTVRSDVNQLDELSTQVAGDLSDTIGGAQSGGVDAMLQSVGSLNMQIANYETGGQTANDLRDQRNNLLDQISADFDINVTQESNGMVTVALKNDSTHMLIDENNNVEGLETSSDGKTLTWQDGSAANVTGGSVGADIELLNGDGTGTGTYGNLGIPAMNAKLNAFAAGLTTAINSVVTTNDASGQALLQCDGGEAKNLSLTDAWTTDAALLTENYKSSDTGNYIGQFISAFSGTSAITFQGATYSGTIQDFTDSISMDVANRLSYIKQMASSSDSIVKNITSQRSSVSGVSIDEEGINIIKYQQSYNAAARVVTAINDMLDTLINSMGVR
ncbi:MAG: flagellar hook-associated protein FlgK [Clostridia bacterium]|nr:flagellar hook-associated protein FlgK [Clostridia bacterium]